ncbi:MAG: aldose epimerase family protein [Bacteroidota bacterium]
MIETSTLVKTFTISNSNGMELEVLNYGATIVALRVPDKYGNTTNVTVGFDNLEDYYLPNTKKNALFLGASVGRFAGRISNGGITVNKIFYPLHSEDKVHLHGGKVGFDKKYWELAGINEGKNPWIKLSYRSVHLEEGYPGNLDVSVIYQLLETNTLKITYTATTDKTTHVNLTNHSYFNLNGKHSIRDHSLFVNSERHLGVFHNLIPNGHLKKSKGTLFDLSQLKTLDFLESKGFDDTFVLKDKSEVAATLMSPTSGIKMDVFTNQPAIVIYTPKVFEKNIVFKNGIRYTQNPAICFETQKMPDAPNKKRFESTILEAGDIYTNETMFQFSRVAL